MRETPKREIGNRVLVGLALLILLTPAHAQELVFRVTENRVNFHGIDVFILPDGSATVEERFFFMYFAGEGDQFAKDFEENNPSVAEWKKDYAFIHPHIGRETSASNIEFLLSRTPNDEPTLTMIYKYPAGLVQQMQTENPGRSTRYRLSDDALISFIAGGTINIPTNTQIKFHFPSTGIVDVARLPQGVTAAGNVVTLTNFQSNSLEIQYTVLTPIADPIDAGKIITGFIQSPLFLFIVVIVLLIGVYTALNSREISAKLEKYIIDHSEFRPSPKQDIDGDLETADEKG